jgi:predicted acetyltransferase
MNTKRPGGMTLSQSNLRIAQLAQQAVQTFSGPEDLSGPLDWDVQVAPLPSTVGPAAPAQRLTVQVNGVAVSGCTVIDYLQQVGPCRLRMGGVAGVSTHPEHRFKGYSKRVMFNSLRWMRQAGYDVSMLFGIPGFYPRFGFAPAFPEVRWRLAVRDAERLPCPRPLKFVDFDAQRHLPSVLAMYETNNAAAFGPLVRRRDSWQPFRRGRNWGLRAKVRVALEGRRPAGYFVYDAEEPCRIVELGYARPQALPAILRSITQMALAARVEEIQFRLGEDHLAMRLCAPLGIIRRTRRRADGWEMARLMNVQTTLQKLSPLLASRVSGQGRLILRTNLDSVALSWRRGRMAVKPLAGSRPGGKIGVAGILPARGRDARDTLPVLRLPQWALAQLIFGFGDVEALALAGTLAGGPAALGLAAEMFPPQRAYFHLVDEF